MRCRVPGRVPVRVGETVHGRIACPLLLSLCVLALTGPVRGQDEDGLPTGPRISDYGLSLEGRGGQAREPSATAPATTSADSSVSSLDQVAARQGKHGTTALLGHYLNGEELGDPGVVPLSQRGSLSGSSLLDPESESGFALDPNEFSGDYTAAEKGQDPEWTWLDTAQATLDGVGVVDPTGIADLVNGLVYFGRGKASDGFIAMAGIIPYIGDTAKLGKYGAKGAKAAMAASEAAAKAKKFSNRTEAFRRARFDMGIPRSQKPFKVQRAKLRDLDGNPVLDKTGRQVEVREYLFRREKDGKVFGVQEHALGHSSKAGVGNQGAHFNVRSVDPATGKLLNDTPPGFQKHYSWGETP